MKKLKLILIFSAMSLVIFAQEKTEKHFDIFKASDIFNAVLRELDVNYVDSLEHEKLISVALNKLTATLDPYTNFIPESKEDELKAMTSGIYGGIGAFIQKHGENVVISEPRFGMPAQKNDLRAGDEIIEINGENMTGKQSGYVSEKLKGIPGTEISLKIKRFGEKKLVEKRFVREVIQMNCIEYYGVVGDSVGYIQLNDFTDKSFITFKAALGDLAENHKIKSLIIDLRDNGGGLVSEAANIASLFVPRNTQIVSMSGKNKSNLKNYTTPFSPMFPDMPIVFLINENTASAAEILAGAFQDLDRATVIGERSYGKGLVQSIRPLLYNSYLKVTIAKYYLPSGRCIQAIDYINSNGERAKTIPDSLTVEFKTAKGRTVRDKSGITPDIFIEDNQNFISILYNLYTKNIIFDFATEYFYNHKKIADAQTFKISDNDYNDFVSYVTKQEFSYQLESEKALQSLKEMLKIEGYENRTAEILAQLSTEIKPDLYKDLANFRADIQPYIEGEIIKRYYFQTGAAQYRLQTDKWVEKGIETLK
ncbi:MAG: S41 family peptidase [Prevotellaceae bacterium]|jgi:carboxyl-terminal processing protease|nr:S41 family peptidase [Prevotellaceae bacterium]